MKAALASTAAAFPLTLSNCIASGTRYRALRLGSTPWSLVSVVNFTRFCNGEVRGRNQFGADRVWVRQMMCGPNKRSTRSVS